MAELENSSREIQRIINIKNPQIEHLVLLNNLEASLGKLLQYYILESKHLTSSLQIEEFWRNSGKQSFLRNKLRNDDFSFQIQMIASIEELHQYLNVVTLYVNSKLLKEQNSSRTQYIYELIEDILEWSPENSFINSQGKKLIDSYYNNILHIITKKPQHKLLAMCRNIEGHIFPTDKEQKQLVEEVNSVREKMKTLDPFRKSYDFQKELSKFWNQTQQIIYVSSESINDCFVRRK